MDAKTRLINYDLVKRYIEGHRNLYTEYEVQAMLWYLKSATYPEIYRKEELREIFNVLGLIPEEENIYNEFASQIEKVHSLEGKRIIEVGGGIYPHLAKQIILRQNSGIITVYDPRLDKSIKSTERMILRREIFTRETPTENANLLVGLMPCKGAEPLLEQAIKKEIDFIIWLCEGGPHGDCYDYYEDEDEWLSSMLVYARRGVDEKNMGTLERKYIKKYSENYPIIYNSKK